MLTFYFSKGSSALAAHILLLEVEAEFTAVEISIPNKDHQTPEFLARNPKGRIPVLETEHGVITENPAILEYIAATHAASACLPQNLFEQAKARSLCAYLCATAHVAFAHKQRGARWADAPASLEDMQGVAPRNLRDCAAFVEDDLPLSPWALGNSYSYCDPYLFQFTRWLDAVGVSLDQTPKLAAHRNRMLSRASTRTACVLHGV